MSFKFWSKFLFYFVFIFFIVISILNYIVNPYKIFDHNLFNTFFKTKHHTVSVRMSTFYTGKYLQPYSIVMGSSRIGAFSQSIFDKYLGEKVYVMAMPGSNIEEQSQYLLYMINNYNVKNILWSLDFFSFNPDLPNDPDFTYNRLSTSFLVNDDYKIALFSLQATKNSFKTILDNIKSPKIQKEFEQIKEESNKKYYSMTHRTIDANTKSILKNYPKKYLMVKNFNNSKSILNNMKKVEKVLQLCQEKKVNAYIYTSPVSKDFINLYETLGLKHTFDMWKYEISKITSYTDFCTYNSITNNRYNFIDGTHIMPKYEKQIFGRIFHDKSINIPDDFGIYSYKSAK